MKVYISGPVTGTEDYMERFRAAEEKLKAAGHMVYNPAAVNSRMPEGTAYGEYMRVSFLLLGMAEAVYMLEGWQQSGGAKMEYAVAEGMGYKLMFEEG